MSGSSNGASQSSNGHTGVPFDDPRSLLRVYPFATYTPTARVAEHFSPHTTTYQEPTTPSSLYPQHVPQFDSMDKPSSEQEWRLRQQLDSRMREMLAGSQQRGETYSRMPYPSPDTTHPAPYSPGSPHAAVPSPYTFLPSGNHQEYREPLTPASLPSPSHSTSASEFFERYVDDINARSSANGNGNGTRPRSDSNTPPKSHQTAVPTTASAQTTPTIARTLASTSIAHTELESPDPLAMSGPSPSKKPKYTERPVSPVRTHSNLKIKLKINESQVGSSSSTQSIPTANTAGPSSQAHGPIKRAVPEVVIPVRKRSASPVKPIVDDLDSEEDDLDWGDDGMVDQDGDYAMSDPAFVSPSPTRKIEPKGSGRTGERDQRSNSQKLQTYLEDIFEESDSFPAEPTQDDVSSSKYYSAISQSGLHPLLSLRAIGKIVDYATRLKGKRRSEGVEWDIDALSRILRMLEKVMREADEIDVFVEPKKVDAVAAGKKIKGVKGKKGSKSPDLLDEAEVKEEVELSDDIVRRLEGELQKVATAGVAAAAVLALLDLEGLSKQMYSEDLLSSAVSVTKDQMTKVVFPVVSGLNGEKTPSAFLNRVVAGEQAAARSTKTTLAFIHPSLAQIVRSTLMTLPRMTSLISRVDISFSDSLVIQAVYLAISPLFLSESSAAPRKKGKERAGGGPIASLMKTYRTEAMGCLRATFARYENQRQWIIEEILSSIVKVPDQAGPRMRFQLANGNAIHTMSALLLQLLQASSYGAVARVRKLRASLLEAEILESGGEKLDILQEEARICSEAIESVFTSAKMVASYLVQRSGTSKANKTSMDTDYKAVLDTLVNDLLTVLYRPEWPAASLFLNVISRLMMSSVEDSKSGSENSAAKSIALDHLGDIAARIRSLGKEMGVEPTPTFDEVISAADPVGAKALIGSHRSIDTCLTASAEEDDMYSCARDMTCVVWAQELHAAIQKTGSIIEKLSAEKDEDAVAERERLQVMAQTFKAASRDVWQANDQLFETKDPRQAEHALKASISLARGRSLQSAFDPILRAIGESMDSTVVALRSKALRALGSIVVIDPDVLAMPFVKRALEDRLSDTSPAVRDAAVDLVGKYIVQKPTLAAEYYRHIADRIEDSGVGVRKRVIKLLTGIFGSMADPAIQSDICCRMIEAMSDHDDVVKALATKSLADLLYPTDASGSSATLLTDIVAEYHGDQRSLESAFQNIIKDISGGVGRYQVTIEALISRLIDATEQPEFDALSHVKAIHLLCASDPSLMDNGKASVLLSYLRTPVKNPDDQATNDTLLRIFKRSIPAMPKVTSTFATDLVRTLAPMVNKPSGGFAALRELVSCLCVAVSHLTRDFAPLTRMLRACESRLRAARVQYAQTPPEASSSHVTAYMLYITALIIENVNLDKLAEDDDLVHREIRTITELRLSEYFFDLYLDLSRYSIFQNAPSVALGSLFHAYPSLILRDEAVEWMQLVFASSDLDGQARLFRVVHEFLESEMERKAAGKVDKDIAALIGNNQDITESGVSTAVVQRNIGAILNGSKSAHPGLQDAALGVLDFTVRQGLYHPLECLPILISLETSEVPVVAEKALALHAHLHTKHASLVNIRFLDFARASYDYQRSITAEVSGHRHGQALLQDWYSLISEKRTWRIDLLKSFCRAFDYDVSRKDTVDIGLVLYLSDNLATFEYKLQDEPMSVVHYLGTVIASCIHLASLLESGKIEGEAQDLIEGKKLVVPNSQEVVYAESAINASIVVCLALATKNHLLGMWSLSEDKCLKHTPGKKSAMGDKPAHRKGLMGMDLGRLPLVRGVRTVDEFRSQAATFLQLLTEDGSLGDH